MNKKVYIHIHIPKTAGCFIKALEAPKIFYPDFFTDQYTGALHNHFTIKFLKKYLPASFDKRVGFFTVVRNPYARIYSWWKFLKRYKRFGCIYQPLVTDDFETFVKDLYDDYYLGYYGLQSQLYYISGYEDVDFQFFKLEEIEKLKDFLVNECGATWSDKKVNESPGEDYRTVYTLEMVKMVKEKFKEEFETFGYSTNL
jgi:hypothetical protein